MAIIAPCNNLLSVIALNCKLIILRKLLLFLFLFAAIVPTALAQPKANKLSERERLEFDKYFFLGLKEKLINNYADAEDAFKTALNINNQNADAWFLLSSVLLMQKKVDLAESACEKAVLFEPNNQWYLTQMAGIYKIRSQYALAAKTQEKLFSVTKNVSDLYDLAESYYLDNKPKLSIKTLDRAEKIVGPIEQLYLQRQHIYISINKVNKALKQLDKLITLYPEQLRYMGMKADVLMANNRIKEGVALYNKVLRVEPNNGYAAFALADYYHSISDTATWYIFLKTGIASNVSTREKVEVMISIIPKKELPNHFEQCLHLVNLFIQTNAGDAAPLMLKGDLFLEQRDFVEARNSYKNAVELDANALIAWEQIILCDQQLNNNLFLIEDCKQIIALFPSYGYAYLLHANASMLEHQYHEAIYIGNKGMDFMDSEESKIALLGILAESQHKVENFNLRDSAYNAILALDPNNIQTLNNWAYYLCLQKENLNKADSMSYKTIQLDPESSFNLDTYGWILYQKQEYIKAKEYIEKSLSIMPNNPEVLEHLGDIEFKLNNLQEALKNWEKAKELGSTNKNLNEKIRLKKLIE